MPFPNRSTPFRTDRQQAAFDAAMSAWFICHPLPEIPTRTDSDSIQSLADDIRPYSHTFRIDQHYSSVSQIVFARIVATDEGCVNQGNTLAEAWCERPTDSSPYFYWES